ncbi:MAG TPA: hypothetical protein VGN84_02915 [Solirubrobacterales bacterium]|jgi:hypothetical protein|nr:hypothetical protein [Solirubrobacterales bacterium]
MDTARQVLRFSIPGSVTLLVGTAFLVLGRILQGDSWQGIESAVEGNVSAVLAIFASIPLGFLIYQVYYSTYRAFVWPWPWRWSRGEMWVRIDRGAQVLKGLPDEQLAQIGLIFGTKLEVTESVLHKVKTPVGNIAHAYVLHHKYLEEAIKDGVSAYSRYQTRWKGHWNVVRALVEISEEGDLSGAIRSEYMILSDLYHALGACRTGVLLAWSISLFACIGYLIAGSSVIAVFATLALTAGLAAIFFFVLHRARGNTWTSAQEGLTLSLSGLFKRKPELLQLPGAPGSP